MAFPTNLTNAVDGITDVMADHLNTLEAKVGIDGSLVTTSLDYLLKNPASVDPGHTHTGIGSDGITALTGDVAASGPGSAGATIQAGVVSLSKMANLAANSIIGNNTGTAATPLALSASAVKSLLAIGQADVAGLTTASSPTFAALIAASLTSAGALGLNAGGLNQNIVLTPSGTGCTILTGKVGIGTTNPVALFQIGDGTPTTAANGIQFGTDPAANLYRSSASTIKTDGNLRAGGSVIVGSQIYWPNASIIQSLSDGVLRLSNYAANGFIRLDLGPATSGFPALAVSGSDLQVIRADGSTNANLFVTGNLGIGTTSPNAAALLHLSSTTKGFLPPVMATAQKNAIGSPPAGLVVYDSTLNKLCVYTGAAWETITSS